MVETAEAKQVCRAASTLLYPELNFQLKQCGKYTRDDFQKILSRIAFDQESANTGGNPIAIRLSMGLGLVIGRMSRW